MFWKERLTGVGGSGGGGAGGRGGLSLLLIRLADHYNFVLNIFQSIGQGFISLIWKSFPEFR